MHTEEECHGVPEEKLHTDLFPGEAVVAGSSNCKLLVASVWKSDRHTVQKQRLTSKHSRPDACNQCGHVGSCAPKGWQWRAPQPQL